MFISASIAARCSLLAPDRCGVSSSRGVMNRLRRELTVDPHCRREKRSLHFVKAGTGIDRDSSSRRFNGSNARFDSSLVRIIDPSLHFSFNQWILRISVIFLMLLNLFAQLTNCSSSWPLC